MRIIELTTFLRESRIQQHTLERWIEQRWIIPEDAERRAGLSDINAARACFIRDLQDDMGVNEEGVEIVLHLLDQLHGMRSAMQTLRAELDRTADAKSADAD